MKFIFILMLIVLNLPNIGPAILFQLFFLFLCNKFTQSKFSYTTHYRIYVKLHQRIYQNRKIINNCLHFYCVVRLIRNDLINFTLTLFQNLQIIYDIHSLASRSNLIFTSNYLSSCTKLLIHIAVKSW